jgi:hypothetical protein
VVATSSSERTGVLVLRLWTEDERGLKARISSSVDLDSAPARTNVATSVDDIRAIVVEFLTAFANRSCRDATSR